ncbi:hypothetical protein PR048_011389 [Dryococelus australis]|uniref:PiggyBac transposable element-derived protein domain-containing protein n=1 Tax=Dryococelus australis TaxID=614101 RepID=A0ABQ9HLE9_9NEOP|nr:hypothetical protein PR048_011389 [Dryococelus australis]
MARLHFRATISLKRFYLLLHALRFDDFNDRAIWKATDDLALIRNIFEEFVGEYTTVDKILEAFRGYCSILHTNQLNMA